MNGVWPRRMPKPPLAPGARTSSQATERTRRSGVTMSRVSAIGYPPAASFLAFSTASSMPPTM